MNRVVGEREFRFGSHGVSRVKKSSVRQSSSIYHRVAQRPDALNGRFDYVPGLQKAWRALRGAHAPWRTRGDDVAGF